MPMFEYRCPVCGNLVDEIHDRDYSEGVTCKKCGADMKKLLSSGTKYRTKPGDFFEAFESEDILPSGEPVAVRSKEHLQSLARENNLKVKHGRAKLM
jgi:putative FmdB family regulatory protein